MPSFAHRSKGEIVGSGDYVFRRYSAIQSVTLNITGTGYNGRSYVKVNGTTYTSAATVTVNTGDVITLYVKNNRATSCDIDINGQTFSSESSLTKTISPTGGNLTIELFYSTIYIAYYGSITVTGNCTILS